MSKENRPEVVDLPSALDRIHDLEKEVRALRTEKRILAVGLITAGFVLLIFSFVTEKAFHQRFPAKPAGVSAPASPEGAVPPIPVAQGMSGDAGKQEASQGK